MNEQGFHWEYSDRRLHATDAQLRCTAVTPAPTPCLPHYIPASYLPPDQPRLKVKPDPFWPTPEMGAGRNKAILGWAADELMRRQLKDLPLAERVAQWPSHTMVSETMSKVAMPTKDLDLGEMIFGMIDVPPWKVKEKIDLEGVHCFSLESHHGVPVKVQEWLGLTKDADSVPAYLTTMLEHRGDGTGVGIHQRLAEKLGRKIGTGPVPLNQGKHPRLTDEMILEALEETYKEAGLDYFWEVCVAWINKT